MKYNKKSMVMWSQLITIILVIVVLIILLLFQNQLFAQSNKESASSACKMQLTVASQGKPVGFDECRSYLLLFKEDVAEKKALNKDKAETHELYDYETVLNKLKNRNLIDQDVEIKHGKVPSEVIYYILSEEAKFCYNVYSANNFETFTVFKKDNSHMCHSCNLVMFRNVHFKDDVSMKGLNYFFRNMPADGEKLTYYEYLQSRNHKPEPKYQLDSNLNENRLYNLMITYDKIPAEELPEHIKESAYEDEIDMGGISADFDKDMHRYVETSHIVLIDQDFYADVCSCSLSLAPNKINANLKSYPGLLNEAILFMV